MSSAHELAQTATEQMSHVARGCRSSVSHNPAPYEKAHDVAVSGLERLAAGAERLRETLREATYIVDGRVPHRFLGQCPDEVDGPDQRDPDCPACQWLDIAERALEASG